MSIAVRVSVWILGVCVFISAGFAVWTYLQKQTLEGKNQTLQREIDSDASQMADLRTKAKQVQNDADQLNNKISQAEQEKAQAQNQYDELKRKFDGLQSQINQANSDRDEWKNRVDTVSQERDSLMEKIKKQQKQLDSMSNAAPASVVSAASTPATAGSPGPIAAPMGADAVSSTTAQGDHYLAALLLQKADLQVQVEKQKFELDQAALQVADLKKQNSDLDVAVKQLSNDKDEIAQKIKYGQDLADNLSIDLARSRNEQQAVNDRADKLKEENLQLLSQIRSLTSTKLELERTVTRLINDKDSMQKKLIETESVIQSRIDDIWKIKKSLDQKIAENSPSASSTELPPIVVNAPQQQEVAAPAAVMAGKTQGSIISINQPNNFVIVDLGQENSSVSVGRSLTVYRNGSPIAVLEVIQVRRDICAADIKSKMAELKVGDTVSF